MGSIIGYLRRIALVRHPGSAFACIFALALAIVLMPRPAVAQSEQAVVEPAASVPGLDELLARGDDENEEYIIGVGDVLQINVWKEPDVSIESVAVRSDGKISVPLVKEVYAAGLSPLQLEDVLTQKLRQYINNPVVTAIVLEVRSQRIFIVGNVAASGMLPLEPGLTVMKAIGLAGGLTEFARRKKIFVLREAGGQQQKMPFDYPSVLSGKSPELDFELEPGDTIFVP